jgi:hypothetical protein
MRRQNREIYTVSDKLRQSLLLFDEKGANSEHLNVQ